MDQINTNSCRKRSAPTGSDTPPIANNYIDSVKRTHRGSPSNAGRMMMTKMMTSTTHMDSSSMTSGNDRHVRCSVESMLAVPVEVIFRKVPQSTQRKPLLTRAEAQCLLKLTLLAQEIDVLVSISEQALAQRRWCRLLRKKLTQSQIQQQRTYPLLCSVVPIVAIHEQLVPNKCLKQVQRELDRLLIGLRMCAATLRQSSEQNWTLSESILDALADDTAESATTSSSGKVLAQEKRKVAELEEELCHRIDNLVSSSMGIRDTASVTASSPNSRTGTDLSDLENTRDLLAEDLEPMRDVCKSILGLDKTDLSRPYQQQQQTNDDVMDPRSTRTQPDSDFTGGGNPTERGDEPPESQNSYMRKTSAAEALAVLAEGYDPTAM